jgi:hypothetical protein
MNTFIRLSDYHQALRDITIHADFPYVSPKYWPTKPE